MHTEPLLDLFNISINPSILNKKTHSGQTHSSSLCMQFQHISLSSTTSWPIFASLSLNSTITAPHLSIDSIIMWQAAANTTLCDLWGWDMLIFWLMVVVEDQIFVCHYFPINSNLYNDSNMRQMNQKFNLSPQGSSLRGKYCHILFDLTILSFWFPTLTPPTSYPTYLWHLLLSTYSFNIYFPQPLFLSWLFLWHVTILSPPTSVSSSYLVLLFSNSTLILHYLHMLFH